MSAAVTRARGKQISGAETRVDQTERRVDDPDSANANGMTPLMRVAGDGLVDFVQVILDRGADVNAKRNDGFNALALAAFFGHSQVVRLLLKRGADVEAAARGTSPETWADVRGFIGIGDLLRKTRQKKNIQEPAPVTAVLQEQPRFSGPVVEEKRAKVASEPGQQKNLKPVLETTPVKEFAVEENKAGKTAPTSDHVVDVKTERPTPTVVAPPPRAARALPEIKDFPPVIAPEFHPASVFVARISSSWKNLAALIVVALAIGGIATFALPQIVRSFTGGQTKAVTNTTEAPASTDPVAQPQQSVSSQIETPAPVEQAAPSKATGTASDSKSIESAHQSSPPEAQLTTSSGTAKTDTTDNSPSSRPESRISGSSAYPRGSSVAKTMFRSSVAARKQKTISATAKSKPEVADPEPKPAPLSVEVSRSRTVLSTAPGAANESSGSQSPLSITPNQSRTKVIRWP